MSVINLEGCVILTYWV